MRSWQCDQSTILLAGETSTSLAITVRMRTSKPTYKTHSAFNMDRAFNMGKAFADMAFSSKGSLGDSLRGSLNKEAAFTLSDSEPGPHQLTLTNFHGEVKLFVGVIHLCKLYRMLLSGSHLAF